MAQRDLTLILKAQNLAQAAMDQLNNQLSHTESLASKAGKGLGGLMDGLGKLGLAGLGVKTLADTVGGLASSMVAGNAEFERYEVQFGVLLGSAKAAKERLADLADFGAKTPFELPEVVRADKILQGFGLHAQDAAKRFGFAGSEIRTIAGDVAAGTGAQFEEIAGYIGKFSSGATGEAIARFQELGIVTRQQLTEMGLQFSKSGELISPLDQSMGVLLQAMKTKFGGMMDAQSGTFEGMMSNLQDWIGQTKRAIMQPIFEVLKDKLKDLLAFLSSDTVKNAISWFATTLANMTSGLMGLLGRLGPVVGEFVGLIRQIFAGNFGAGGLPIWFEALTGMKLPPAVHQFFIDLEGRFQFLQDAARTFIDALSGNWHVGPGIQQIHELMGRVALSMREAASTAREQLQPALDNLASIGRVFSTEFGPMKNLLDELNKTMQLFGDSVGPNVNWVKQLADVINVMLQVAVASVIVPLNTLTSFLAFALPTAISIVSAALGALNAVITTVKTLWQTIPRVIGEVWDNIKSSTNAAWQAVIGTIQGTIATIVGALQATWNTIVNTAQGAWNGLVDIVKGAIQAVVNIFQWLYNHNYYFKALVDEIVRQWEMLKALTAAIWGAITWALQMAWEAITTIAQIIWNALSAFFLGIWDAIKTTAENKWNQITDNLTTTWNAIKDIAGAIWNGLVSFLGGIWDAIVRQFTSAHGPVTGAANSIWDTIRKAAEGLVNDALNWGRKIVQGLIDGLLGKLNDLRNAAGEIAGVVAGFLGFHSPTKEGPGREADQWGPNLIRTFATGIKTFSPVLSPILNTALLGPGGTTQIMNNPQSSTIHEGSMGGDIVLMLDGEVLGRIARSRTSLSFGSQARIYSRIGGVG